ncbi:PAS domain-containing protein [Chelativorans sp.]|uniref:PAS domain-containing protein n=1 Tax=Chelativorans sp. TaxID=2203393 RepID=UPI002811069B|nr:PAS domain-containing protein [Chelativorans sp.]
MIQDGSMALFLYWNRLRGSRAAPRRMEIEPAEIKALLADTFILEQDARRRAVFRLAGTRICSSYGKELKGHSFASLWAENDQKVLGRLVESALDDQSVVAVNFEGVSREGRSNPFELVILPLDGGGERPHALGTILPAAKPYWLGADPILQNHLEGFRVIDPDREPVMLRSRPKVAVPPLFEDGGAPGEALAGNGRRIRHLVVFDGGRRE